jgi:hypothetical protein
VDDLFNLLMRHQIALSIADTRAMFAPKNVVSEPLTEELLREAMERMESAPLEPEWPAPHHPRCFAVVTQDLGDCSCSTSLWDYRCAVAVLGRLAELDAAPRPLGVVSRVFPGPDNWGELRVDGWRWIANLPPVPRSKDALLRAVYAMQKRHGGARVTVGAPAIDVEPVDTRDDRWERVQGLVGLYVRWPWCPRGLYPVPTRARR